MQDKHICANNCCCGSAEWQRPPSQFLLFLWRHLIIPLGNYSAAWYWWEKDSHAMTRWRMSQYLLLVQMVPGTHCTVHWAFTAVPTRWSGWPSCCLSETVRSGQVKRGRGLISCSYRNSCILSSWEKRGGVGAGSHSQQAIYLMSGSHQ